MNTFKFIKPVVTFVITGLIILFLPSSCTTTTQENSNDSSPVKTDTLSSVTKEKNDTSEVFNSCSNYPFYVRYMITADNYVAFRLPVPKQGAYKVVLGSNTLDAEKYMDLLDIYITGEFHKQIPYTKEKYRGRTNMNINFTVDSATAYHGTERTVFFELRVNKDKFNDLTESERKMLSPMIGEIGFGPEK